jgi:hypothetical protein
MIESHDNGSIQDRPEIGNRVEDAFIPDGTPYHPRKHRSNASCFPNGFPYLVGNRLTYSSVVTPEKRDTVS